MTSELRELVCVPMASAASSTMTSRPARASSRAMASPTTPAPITAQSTCSVKMYFPAAILASKHVTRRHPRDSMADYWTTDWLNSSALFAPLRTVGAGLPEIGWPDTELLNALAGEAGRVVNAQGQRVRFVAQAPKSKDWREDFEPRAF